ncbi:2904_t:CDS:2, partial [Gigaspora rosea]
HSSAVAQAESAVEKGFHQRDPDIIGLLGTTRIPRPYYGIICDATGHQYMQGDRMAASLLELPNGDLLTMDNSGIAVKAVNAWKKLSIQHFILEYELKDHSKGRQQTIVDVKNLEPRAETKQPLELTDAQSGNAKRLQEDFELYRHIKHIKQMFNVKFESSM